MGSKSASKTCCQVRQDSLEPLQKTIDCSWMRCCTATGQEFRGGTYLRALPISASYTPVTPDGSRACLAKGVRVLGPGQASPRTQPKRSEHQDSCRGRRTGQPDRLLLTPGQAHDLKGADVLLKDTPAQTNPADKACDAQARLIEPPLNTPWQVALLLSKFS